MEWILTREVVIAIALTGAAASLGASILRARGTDNAVRARQLNIAAYALMGVSMLLFIVIGFRAH